MPCTVVRIIFLYPTWRHNIIGQRIQSGLCIHKHSSQIQHTDNTLQQYIRLSRGIRERYIGQIKFRSVGKLGTGYTIRAFALALSGSSSAHPHSWFLRPKRESGTVFSLHWPEIQLYIVLFGSVSFKAAIGQEGSGIRSIQHHLFFHKLTCRLINDVTQVANP